MRARWMAFLLVLILVFPGCGHREEAVPADNEITPEASSPAEMDLKPGGEKQEEKDKTVEVTVHNADELIRAMAPNTRILLEPGGDYDLHKSREQSKYWNEYGEFINLHGVTLEGLGNGQVDFFTDQYFMNVLTFRNCSNITLINLNAGHYPPIDDGGDSACEGHVLAFHDGCNAVTIKNCTLFGCGATGIYADLVNGLECSDTVIKECSVTIMSLSRLTDATFTHCTFERNTATFVDVMECENVVFKDCTLTGFWELPYFAAWSDDHYKSVYRQDEPSTVADASFSGITLKNVSFGLDESGVPGVTVSYTHAQDIVKDLKAVFPGAQCAGSVSFNEMSGGEMLDLSLVFDVLPVDDDLRSTVTKLMGVISHYPPENDLELEIVFSDADDANYYISYPNLDQALDQFTKAPDMILGEASYAHFGNAVLDYSKAFGNDQFYFTAEQASDLVVDLFFEFVTYYPENKGRDVPITQMDYLGSSKEGEDVYYAFSIVSDLLYQYYYVDASTGEQVDFLEGRDLVRVPDPQLKKAALEEFQKSGYALSEGDLVFVRRIGDAIISIQTATDSEVYYTFKEKGGVYAFTPYERVIAD